MKLTGALFTLSFNILILNSRSKEGASDANVFEVLPLYAIKNIFSNAK